MKLNVRLILISFTILFVISVTSMAVYYSLAGSLISKQQNQAILNATNDFVFLFQNTIQKPEEDFKSISPRFDQIKQVDLNSTTVDFMFTLVEDSLINFDDYTVKKNSFINIQSNSFKQFFKNNPNIILHYSKLADGENVFYGNIITSIMLDSLARYIHAEVALVINDSPVEVSNSLINQEYLLNIVNAERFLKFKNNFDIYSQELENSNFVASYVTPKQILTPGGKINFIIFDSFPEAAELRNTLRNVAIIIILAGSALSIIFVLLFTTKLRKQISFLSEAVEFTSKGDLNHRVPIILKDEVGKLGEAFNNMLDEIKKNKEVEKEYSDFIAMINQNPSLQEISDAALFKIIKSTGLTFGILYIVEHKNLRVISSFGIGKNIITHSGGVDFYSNAIEKREALEFEFHENYPEIKTGLAQIKIKYLLVYPVVYNKQTIAIFELASESAPENNIKKYIESIHDQLAIGLINARSLEQLENLVQELKKLNDEYQKQNKQIIEQNKKQKELHQQLQEKALEIEQQRKKAVELTKVKSQFLASMSHELRTPLISILGLTELMSKDTDSNSKIKERSNIVFRNGKKLLAMITNILEFSKFDTGKIELKKESFLFDDLMEEIIPSAKILIDEKKLTFEVIKIPDVNFVLNTDKTKLEQILNNLLVNAVKFTEKGKIVINIMLLNNSDLKFEISDTGIGITEENKKMIFDEFQQVDVGNAKKFGGVGLGLAICKKYIELMDSELKLESIPGKGSSFYFILKDIVLDKFEKSEIQENTSIVKTNNNVNKNILLVSNNSDVKKIFADYLIEKGMSVSWVPLYKSALELIKTSQYAYIIAAGIKNENVWQFISDLKSGDMQEGNKLLITSIIEEDKIGWQFVVDEYMPKLFFNYYNDKILFSKINSLNSKVTEILFVSSDIDYYQSVKKYFEQNYSLIHFSNKESLFNRIAAEIPDIIMVDVESISFDSIEIVLNVKEKYQASNVPIIFVLPEIIGEDLCRVLNDKLLSVTKSSGSNILEVLKNIGAKVCEDKSLIVVPNVENIQQVESAIEFSKNIDADKDKPVKPTILIVDDDSDSLFTIGEFVKELNYETIFAHNGMECLVTLNHIEPDLILLDIMMPQMDGFETIKNIRAQSKFAGIPVIALTAYAMLENKSIIEKNGFNDLVTKPVNSKILASKIKEYIKKKTDVS